MPYHCVQTAQSGCRQRCRRHQVLNNLLLVDKLLSHKTCRSDHSQAAVVNLLGLKDVKLLLVGRAEAKGIESEVSRLVVRAEGVTVISRRECPSTGDAVGLRNACNEASSCVQILATTMM